MKGESATRVCENCGQPVLQSDTACWHCDARLAPAEPTAVAAAEQSDEAEGSEGAPPVQILFYVVATAVIALALLLVIRSLGQQPRLSTSFETDEVRAVELSDPEGSFTLQIPDEFIWYFPQVDRGKNGTAAQMAEDPQFGSAAQPLLELAPDSEFLLLAQGDSAVLTITRSERLGRLTVDNVVRSMNGETFPGSTILTAEKRGGSAGSNLAAITLEQSDPSMICRQHFLPEPGGATLASICSNPEQFERQAVLFETILNSLTVR